MNSKIHGKDDYSDICNMAEIGKDLTKAAELLKRGNLVAIPTETVYGLAGNALNEASVLKIFETKNRPHFDPLILHFAYINQAEKYLEEIPDLAYELAMNFWPGPLTLLLPKKKSIPDLVTSGSDMVAIRIPNHPLTLELLRRIEFPLAAPSANPFGYVSPVTAQHVADQLGDKIDYIIDGGRCNIGLESTIVGIEKNGVVVYRWGGLSKESLEAIVPTVNESLNQSSNPKAPGMLKSHYATRKPLFVGDPENLRLKNSGKVIGIISFRTEYNWAAINMVLSKSGDLTEAAKNLFYAMRILDESNCEIILAEEFPEELLGRAINDRLKRASVK